MWSSCFFVHRSLHFSYGKAFELGVFVSPTQMRCRSLLLGSVELSVLGYQEEEETNGMRFQFEKMCASYGLSCIAYQRVS